MKKVHIVIQHLMKTYIFVKSRNNTNKSFSGIIFDVEVKKFFPALTDIPLGVSSDETRPGEVIILG